MVQVQSSLISFNTLKYITVLSYCVVFNLNLITTAADHVNVNHEHKNYSIGLGHICHHHKECANDSICLPKTYQDDLKLKVCQCESEHSNRVGHSCYIKPGHQCYFPEKDPHGRLLLVCMKETECRSGMNKSSPGNGYCMCTDDPRAEEGPFRYLDIEHEIWRCSSKSLFSFTSTGWIFITFWLLYLLCCN